MTNLVDPEALVDLIARGVKRALEEHSTPPAGTPARKSEPEDAWKAEDVARHTGMSLSYVRKGTASGVIPCNREGRAVRYTPETVRAWWAKRGARP